MTTPRSTPTRRPSSQSPNGCCPPCPACRSVGAPRAAARPSPSPLTGSSSRRPTSCGPPAPAPPCSSTVVRWPSTSSGPTRCRTWPCCAPAKAASTPPRSATPNGSASASSSSPSAIPSGSPAPSPPASSRRSDGPSPPATVDACGSSTTSSRPTPPSTPATPAAPSPTAAAVSSASTPPSLGSAPDKDSGSPFRSTPTRPS